MFNKNYNPDVLTCLANLSNDEVFTPPSVVNKILDLLPTTLWSNKDTRVLDPVSKSGVFLREIAKRLMAGLEKEIPDPQRRIEHILQNQLYGVAITELTALTSRRSLYCSKEANGKYSVNGLFADADGNILFPETKHTWHSGKCTFCNASQEVYDRPDALETHAYYFIHAEKPQAAFKNMKFDLIIGNPPYQLSDGGHDKSASPIYQKFVEQAIKLNPKYLSMIMPARWYSGGKGLDEFREKMLNDQRISQIHDFPETSDVFPGLNIRGGVCYFLWDRDHKGMCKVTTYKNGKAGETVERALLEKDAEVFIRYNEAINILHKVQTFNEPSFSKVVSSRKPFGLATNFNDFSPTKTKDKNILLFRFGDNGYISKNQVERNDQWIDTYRLIVPKASPGGDSYPHQVLGRPIISPPNTCSTETYIVIGPFADEKTCENVASYLRTKLARFLILLIKNTQDVPKKVYSFVPMQDFSESWSDEKLYKKYKITPEEIDFIDSMVRPLEATNE